MKTILSTTFTTTALALVLATGAFAANHTPALVLSDGTTAAMPAERDAMFDVDTGYMVDDYEAYTDPLTVADIEEAPLYSSVTGDRIGEVEDTVSEGDVLQYLVLDVGGFLGIGEKTIAVMPSEVMAMRNPGLGDTRIYINATKEQLEALPDYNSQAAAAMEAAVGTLEGNVATGEGTVVPAETVTAETDMAEPIVSEENTMMAGDDAVVVTDTAATDGYMMMDGTAAAEPVFGDRFDVDPSYTVEGYETYTGGYDAMLTEGDVEEAPLYSSITGEEIGEVEDALEQNGVLSALVLDIGGFLGLGEHTITVAPDQVTYVRDPGVLSNVRVYINATKEQLEAYPSYNADL